MKKQNVLESLIKNVGLAVELIDDAVVVLSPEAGSVVDRRIDKLIGQFVNTRAEVVLLMATLYNLKEVRDREMV